MATTDKTVKVTLTAEAAPYIKDLTRAADATNKLGKEIDTVGGKSSAAFTKLSASSSTAAASLHKLEAAQGSLRVAEAKLNDLRSKGVTGAKLAAAEEAVAKSRRDVTIATQAHTKALNAEASAAKKSDEAQTGLVGTMKSFKGVAAGIAGTAIAGFLLDSVKAAGDLEQSIGGVEAVFKDSADVVKRFGETSAQSVGLSTNAFNELITVTGAMLKNKGIDDFTQKSIDLVKIGADLSATFGGSAKDAIDAINAAMRGEADPIERYGIALNETAVNAELASKGLTGLTGSALEQAKATARIDIITRQAADALGHFGQEADTLQGQQQRLNAEWENAKATLGQALLPALTKVTEALRGGLDAVSATAGVWQSIPDPIKAAAGALIVYRLAQDRLSQGGAAIAGTVKSLGEALGFAREAAEKAGGGLKGLSAGFNTFTGTAGAAKAAMGGLKNAGAALMGLAGGPWGAAIAGLTIGFTAFIEAQNNAKAAVDALVGTMDKATGSFTNVSKVNVRDALIGDLSAQDVKLLSDVGVNFTETADAAIQGGKAYDDQKAKLQKLMEQHPELLNQLNGLANSLENQNEVTQGAADKAAVLAKEDKNLGDKAGTAATNVDKVAGATDAAATAAGDAEKATKDYNDKIATLKQVSSDAIQMQQDLATAMGDVTEAAIGADEAQINFRQALDDAKEAAKTNGQTLDITTKAGQDNKQALIDLAEQARTTATAFLNNGESVAGVTQKMTGPGGLRDAFIKVATKMTGSKTEAEALATKYGLTEDAVKDLNTELGKTPKKVVIQLQVDMAAAMVQIAILKAQLAVLRQGAIVKVSGVSPANRARGGIVRGPGTTTSDSIPALLSDQEYVVKAAAVQKYGVDFFDRLNAMRFAQGGFVTRMPAPVSGSGAGIDYDRLGASLARHMPRSLSVYSGADAMTAARTAIRDDDWRTRNVG